MDLKKTEHKLRGQTRRDLIKLATQLKIVGRHRMKKEELVRAISDIKIKKKTKRPKITKSTRPKPTPPTIRGKRIADKHNRPLLYAATKDVISLKAVPPKAGKENTESPRIKSLVSSTGHAKAGLVKLPGHRPGPFDRAHGPEHAEGLPGKVISFYIVPLDPAYKAGGLTGHVPAKPGMTNYSGIEEKGDLPSSYGETKVILLPVSPYLIHSQWEISASDLQNARLRLGSDYEQSRPALRFYDITDVIFDGFNAHRHFDVEIDLDAKNWYVQHEIPGRSYCVDLGMKTEDGLFFPIGRSNVAETPRAQSSRRTETTYMLVQGDYDRVEKVSASPPERESPVDLTEMAEKLFTSGISSKQ